MTSARQEAAAAREQEATAAHEDIPFLYILRDIPQTLHMKKARGDGSPAYTAGGDRALSGFGAPECCAICEASHVRASLFCLWRMPGLPPWLSQGLAK